MQRIDQNVLGKDEKNLLCKVKRLFAGNAGKFETVPFEMAPTDNKTRLKKKFGIQIKHIRKDSV
jgi:hypothetical protein